MESSAGLRILLVEDDFKLAALVSEFLTSKGFVVSIEPRGDTAVDRILEENPDLVILDASDLGREPVASVHIPHRVPPGFHGNWLPEV